MKERAFTTKNWLWLKTNGTKKLKEEVVTEENVAEVVSMMSGVR